jgi:hypothetical protein
VIGQASENLFVACFFPCPDGILSAKRTDPKDGGPQSLGRTPLPCHFGISLGGTATKKDCFSLFFGFRYNGACGTDKKAAFLLLAAVLARYTGLTRWWLGLILASVTLMMALMVF